MQTFQFSLEITNPEDLALFKALAERLGYVPEVEERSTYDPLEDYVLPKYSSISPIDRSKLIIGQAEEPDGYESILPETPIPKEKPFDREAYKKRWEEVERKYPMDTDDDDVDELNRQAENL
jgi:hypothetical protein